MSERTEHFHRAPIAPGLSTAEYDSPCYRDHEREAATPPQVRQQPKPVTQALWDWMADEQGLDFIVFLNRRGWTCVPDSPPKKGKRNK